MKTLIFQILQQQIEKQGIEYIVVDDNGMTTVFLMTDQYEIIGLPDDDEEESEYEFDIGL